MAKRSTGEGLWFAVGALVLVALIPRKVWIGIGIIGASAVIAYLIIKHLREKASARRDAYRHEPTLAELIAASEPQRPAHRPVSPPPLPDRSRTVPETPLSTGSVPVAKRTGDSVELGAIRQSALDANREREKTSRGKVPPAAPRVSERIDVPAYPAPPIPGPPHVPQDHSPLANGPSASRMLELPGQSSEWNRTRQVAIETNRERARALRDKFPKSSPSTNERVSAPVEHVPPDISSQPPASPLMSERGITLGSPMAPITPPRPADTPVPKLERALGDFMSMLQGSPEPERMYSVRQITKPQSAHALPEAPTGFGEGRWIPPGESVTVADVTLPGGMLYVGGRLKAFSGDTDPCLISGQHAVARVGNYRARQMGYWPSYASASPEERRAYLNWLSEGRSDPDCDIGYGVLPHLHGRL